MGTSTLRMDSDGLHSLANTMTAKADGFDNLIATFDAKTKSITEPATWDGDDSVAFAQAALEFKGNLDRASAFLHSVATDLGRTADSYDTTHEGTTARARNL